MSRVRIEYGKAVVMALCGALLLALDIAERSVDGAGLTIAFGALCVYFVLKARAYSRLAAGRRCGQTPRS